MRFRDRLIRFMQGRNGVDAFARFLNHISLGCLCAAILFTFLSLVFLRHEGNTAALVFRILYYVFYGIGILITGIWFFRVFSRNVSKRQAENTRYLYRRQKIESRLFSWKEQWKNRKAYKYFKCPKCKQRIRAPRHKGKIRVTCSKCGDVFITKT